MFKWVHDLWYGREFYVKVLEVRHYVGSMQYLHTLVEDDYGNCWGVIGVLGKPGDRVLVNSHDVWKSS